MPVVPGYDWDAVRAFLAARLVPGVETVDGDTYRRTITMAGAPGLLEVSPGREDCLLLRAHLPYWEGLIHVVDQVGLLLGTEGDRPGAWNRFEAGVSATLAGRPDRDRLLGAFVARLGTPVPGLPEGLGYTFPDPASVTPASAIATFAASWPKSPRSQNHPRKLRRARYCWVRCGKRGHCDGRPGGAGGAMVT